MQQFNKKIFGFKAYLSYQIEMLKSLPSLLSAKRSGRISRAFEEILMLAVTVVNDCKYCSWIHVRAALRHGVEQKESERITNMDLGAKADSYETLESYTLSTMRSRIATPKGRQPRGYMRPTAGKERTISCPISGLSISETFLGIRFPLS